MITALAAQHRFPSIGPLELPAAGGLMGYGVNFAAMFRRAAVFVDKILKGARPGEIPVEQATKFNFVINLNTAKALGLDVPPMLLAHRRGDRVDRDAYWLAPIEKAVISGAPVSFGRATTAERCVVGLETNAITVLSSASPSAVKS